MIESDNFADLFLILKVLADKKLNLPDVGNESKSTILAKNDDNIKFELVVNRKGHKNPDNLTYQMVSLKPRRLIIRLDVSGAPHLNPNGEQIPTPHVHIFNEEYMQGKIAIPLEDLTDLRLVSRLHESIRFFLDYNNVDTTSVLIPAI